MKIERDIGARKGMGFGGVVRTKLPKKIQVAEIH